MSILRRTGSCAPRFKRNDVPEALRQLGRIRPLFAVYLVLGIIVVLIAGGGRYLA